MKRAGRGPATRCVCGGNVSIADPDADSARWRARRSSHIAEPITAVAPVASISDIIVVIVSIIIIVLTSDLDQTPH